MKSTLDKKTVENPVDKPPKEIDLFLLLSALKFQNDLHSKDTKSK